MDVRTVIQPELKDNLMLRLYVYRDFNELQFKRTYKKLASAFGEIVGVYQIIYLIFNLLLNPIIKLNFNIDLLNKVFLLKQNI